MLHSGSPELELASLLDEFMPPEIAELSKELIVRIARKHEQRGVDSMQEEIKNVHAEYTLRREIREELLEEELRVKRRKEIEMEAVKDRPKLNPNADPQ
jgi:hypothetical protein